MYSVFIPNYINLLWLRNQSSKNIYIAYYLWLCNKPTKFLFFNYLVGVYIHMNFQFFFLESVCTDTRKGLSFLLPKWIINVTLLLKRKKKASLKIQNMMKQQLAKQSLFVFWAAKARKAQSQLWTPQVSLLLKATTL